MTPWSMLLRFKFKSVSFFVLFIKAFWIFWVKDLTNRILFLAIDSFLEHLVLVSMWLINEWPLLVPRPMAYLYHPQILKKIFGESWHQTAFIPKKNWDIQSSWKCKIFKKKYSIVKQRYGKKIDFKMFLYPLGFLCCLSPKRKLGVIQ